MASRSARLYGIVSAVLFATLALGNSCSEPLVVYAVTPAEADVQSGTDSVYIQGRGFHVGSISVELEDPSDPLAILPPVSVVGADLKPHSIRIQIPPFVTSRKEYRLVVKRNASETAVERVLKSSHIFLSSSGGSPASKKLRIQYVNWGWVFDCDDPSGELLHATSRRVSGSFNLTNCDSVLLNGFANGMPSSPPGIWPTTGEDPWSVGIWPEWKAHVDQTSRDWSTTCSPLRNPGGSSFVSGLTEAYPRITVINNNIFWLATDALSVQMRALALGGVYSPFERSPQGCAAAPRCDPEVNRDFWPCDDLYVGNKPGCSNWVGHREDTIVVHLVGVLFDLGQEVNPNDPVDGFRAITEQQLFVETNTKGLIVVSDNPIAGIRANPDTNVYSPAGAVPWLPGDGDATNLVGPAQIGYWGHDEQFDNTPNLLSHEFIHLLDQVHKPPYLDPAIPDRVLVSLDASACQFSTNVSSCTANAGRRGFRVDLPALDNEPARPTEEVCATVVNSPFVE